MTNRELFFQHVAQTSPAPLGIEICKADGSWIFGPNGEKYLDLISGISVSNLGHRHPKVVQAIKNQLDNYMHLMVYGEYIQTPQTTLAKALSDSMAVGIDFSVYFGNSGSEAIEGALKLTKKHTGRSGLISCKNAYHGSTHGALSMMGDSYFKEGYGPLLPHVTHIEFGSIADLESINTETAAVLIEPIQGEAGIRMASKEYWYAIRKRCTETGALLIMDEIQTGFGRSGTFWAFQQLGVQPDILVSAKGMGGGMPIGCFIALPEVMKCLSDNPVLGHITTFGGNPVCCAASLATLQEIQEKQLYKRAFEIEHLIKTHLVHPKIIELRCKGALAAVQVESYTYLRNVIDQLLERGVITDWFLFCDNSMRIAPPLTISNEELIGAFEQIIAILNK